MKKFLALILALVMALALVACGAEPATPADEGGEGGETAAIKIGYVYIGDENEGYTAAHMNGIKAAMAKLGIPEDADHYVEYTAIPEDENCYDKCVDLAEQGCNVIFTNSYGHQTYCALAAQEYPDVQFVAMTGDFAAICGIPNLSNAFCNTYESRYVSGVVAGMKLKELLDAGTVTDAHVGYVGAFPYAEVISGYTAFYLGIKSIVPDAHMDVLYTQSWFDQTKEAEAANALMAKGCVIIGQHADSNGAPNAVEAALKDGKVAYSVGYNIDMLSTAPTAALTSAQNDWSVYYEYALSQVMAGEKIATDWCGGYAKGANMISTLGESCAPGTADKVAEVEAAIKDGSLQVFDTANFTVGGKAVTSAPVDMSFGNWTDDGFNEIYHGDTLEAIIDGAFSESTFRAAPYFALKIDGITELTSD